MSLVNALRRQTERFDHPYPHWLVTNSLTPDMLREIASTPIPDGPRAYDGTRAADNGGMGMDGKLRCYIDRENAPQFPALTGLIEELMSPACYELVGDMIGRDLRNTCVRMEVIADRHGFWLKPHVDIKEKLMTLLIYVNPYDESEELGTDIYDEDLQRVKTIPYRNNVGYMFAPDRNTWHGFEKKTIRQERRSILINYVTFATDWRIPVRRAA